MVVIMQNTQEIADLQKTKVNTTKTTKVRADRNKLCTGKEWRPQVQSIIVVSKCVAVFKNF